MKDTTMLDGVANGDDLVAYAVCLVSSIRLDLL